MTTKMGPLIKNTLVILGIISGTYGGPSDSSKLAPMIVHRDKITLSGFSSGGTFAQQLQFSYSSLFSGIAVFSHSYYRCGNGSGLVDDYDRLCTKLFNGTEFDFYNPDLVHEDIKEYVSLKKIEDPVNLRNRRLYVYSGLQNLLFTPRQSLSILSVYERYIASPQSIFTRVQDANLVLPTDNTVYGAPCTEFSESKFFIGKCGFSGVQEALDFLLFPNSSDTFAKSSSHNRDSLLEFDQTEFTRGLPSTHNMDSVGYYYVPRRCKNSYHQYRRCYLHLYFHGCASGRQFANTTHVKYSGLLELAESRNIIMIFPQALSSKPENDIGCWDTFGISGKYYATQDGPQIQAVKRMLNKILQISSQFPGKGSSSSSGGYYPTTTGNGNSNNKKPGYPTHSHHYRQYNQYSTSSKQKQNRNSAGYSQAYGNYRKQ